LEVFLLVCLREGWLVIWFNTIPLYVPYYQGWWIEASRDVLVVGVERLEVFVLLVILLVVNDVCRETSDRFISALESIGYRILT